MITQLLQLLSEKFECLGLLSLQCGDFIEKHLLRSRNIDDVMRAARSSQVKERRQAAFDLASMAANTDDDKFRIVAEGG